ncbi:MAG TPA: GNAT family N-acetyltransferase [Brevundimonas sp.]|jgi:predicted GNAT family acetyltransferase|uniref:GNAT family N-acetyltransferase n=1 Tax=Brevundimonas sp. TaxID=1871086 RepID=UPI002DF59EFC|nr:GNAT family N-acetyltransferase [Brevundimonas sp.]
MTDLDPDIRDDRDSRRYELTLDGLTSVVMYNEAGGGLMITETLVPPPLEGRGVASRMARHVLEDIRRRGLVVLPTCPFFSGYLKKHPEWRDVVHPSYRLALGL